MASVSISGGDKLKAKLNAIAKNLESAHSVSMGFYSESTYADEAHTPVAYVAAIQNFGAPSRGIPARPFFSNTVKDQSDKWGQDLGKLLSSNQYDSAMALATIGEHMQSDLQDSIVDIDSPPLSPVTVMLRGMRSKGAEITGKTVGEAARRVDEGKTNYGASDAVLVDSGHMLNSVNFKVDEE